MCRSQLLKNVTDAFPRHMQKPIRGTFAASKDIRPFNPQIDQFLLDGSEESLDNCYGPEVGQMLEKLQHVTRALERNGWSSVTS